jgi:hypothetical protein
MVVPADVLQPFRCCSWFSSALPLLQLVFFSPSATARSFGSVSRSSRAGTVSDSCRGPLSSYRSGPCATRVCSCRTVRPPEGKTTVLLHPSVALEGDAAPSNRRIQQDAGCELWETRRPPRPDSGRPDSPGRRPVSLPQSEGEAPSQSLAPPLRVVNTSSAPPCVSAASARPAQDPQP